MNFLIDIILPILSIVIPVWATVYTVNKRIRTQTHENHQPHLVLEEVKTIPKINPYEYYLTFVGRNYREEEPSLEIEKIMKEKDENILSIEMHIRNIGYGVATNIKFYNLLTGNQVYGTQESVKDKDQQLFTTLDIASEETKKVRALVLSKVLMEDDNVLKEDHNRILCVYKDLNNVVDSFIITVNVKSDFHYDFFAYQPSSLSYKKWIKENKKQYKQIIKKYNDL